MNRERKDLKELKDQAGMQFGLADTFLKMGKSVNAQRYVEMTRPKTTTSGASKMAKSVFDKQRKTEQYYGNSQKMTADGFYQGMSINDHTHHHSNPPYVVIKPAYRAAKQTPGLKQLEIKNRYSFHSFGEQKPCRPSQNVFESNTRNTLQFDSPYFRDKFEAVNVKHALVDPSHTFVYDPKKKQ